MHHLTDRIAHTTALFIPVVEDLQQSGLGYNMINNHSRKRIFLLLNNTLNTFYFWLYGVRHVVKDHSDSGRGNLLPPHGLLFPIITHHNIHTIPQTG